MPKYYCMQRGESIWICPLNIDDVMQREHCDGHKCDYWTFDTETGEREFLEHLQKHGIADTPVIGSGVIL